MSATTNPTRVVTGEVRLSYANIFDPFTGTGTFIVRLLQSGRVQPHDLARKYAEELHANEIMLLAYYIAAVNIEATYHGLTGDAYEPFPGIALTDTFQSSEEGDRSDTSLFPRNNDRITAQLATDITVILGNPPYSVGQTSANDNNANIKYPTLDAAIADTYAGRSTAQNKNSLYDSYIRAYRWATDRIGDRGVVTFVSNGGWLDGNTADGMRLTLAEDFAKIWVFNLRGNQRTAGEQSRSEGGKVFGAGSRNTVAIFIGIKDPDHTGPAEIHYRDIGDYLTRTEKLDIIDRGNIATIPWATITPNTDGDWVNQRNEAFGSFTPMGAKSDHALFATYSSGLKTGRDAWAYNYSRTALTDNMRRLVETYNAGIEDPSRATDDPRKIKWNGTLRKSAERGIRLEVSADALSKGIYRPFSRQWVYFDKELNERRYQLPKMFPTPRHSNVGFYVVGAGSDKLFSLLAMNLIPDLAFWGSSNGQFFPRWTYEHSDEIESLLPVDGNPDEWGYIRHDNITDWALDDYRSTYGSEVTKDNIFHYVYGILHAPSYRETFAADLKKMLPRIPKVEGIETFRAFVEAGAALMDLHVNYENVEPYPLTINTSADLDDQETWRVTKMKFASRTDKSAIVYNSRVRLEDIPDEAHRYVLGSRSGLEWLIDRYRVKTDKASGIVNDPNDWCDEHDDPRYIVDLIQKVTTVSVETMKIVDSLPAVDVG